MIVLLATAAGGLGALVRFRLAVASRTRWGSTAPGTAAVNLTGAMALGVLLGAGAPTDVVTVVGSGLLGGLTTFSTWVVESLDLADDRRDRAAANLAGQLAVGVALAAAGYAAGSALI